MTIPSFRDWAVMFNDAWSQRWWCREVVDRGMFTERIRCSSAKRSDTVRTYILSRIERKERAMREELHRHIMAYQELEFRALQAEPRLRDDEQPESHWIEEGKTT